MQNDIYKEYADIKFQLKVLEAQEAKLKNAILEDLKGQKLDKIGYSFGKFTVVSRSKYTYSKKIQKLEEELEIKKDDEVKRGIAKVEVSENITFKGPKV